MNRKIQGIVLLLLAALIWGSSFIVMKSATDFLTPAVLLLVRFTLASCFLSLLFYKQVKNFPRNKILGGLLTGVCLFLAYYVQAWGLNFTTPGKNAFLTAVYCAIVPFLVWIFYRQRPHYYHFIAAFICVIGVGFVSLDSSLVINLGDFLTLCGGFLYALHILCITHFSKGVNGGAFTTFQFVGGSLCALGVVLVSEDIAIIQQIGTNLYLQIFYLGFFATAVTMVCQTIGQSYLSECQASLILSLESVFGVIFSVLFYGEVLNLKMIIGFIFIFIAIVISQTKLSFLRHRFVKIMLACLMIGSLFSIKPTLALGTPSLHAPYAYVYDVTSDQQLYAKNADQRIYPASMTKVMTALVAIEHIKDLKEVVMIEPYDLKGLWEAGASVANFEVGEKVTYNDLIHGIILPSGADACRAISRALFGSEEEMVKQMNLKAKALGLKNTHFMNSSGLHHANHYSSTRDMGIITQAALKHDYFKSVFTKRSYRTETSGHYMASSILKAYWRLHMDITHIKGCKTGYTDESKSCLTALVNSQGHDLVCVFAKEDGSDKYVLDAKAVQKHYQQYGKSLTVFKKGDVIYRADVTSGVKKYSDIKAIHDIRLLVDKSINKEDIDIQYPTVKSIDAPITKGESVGHMILKYKGEKLSIKHLYIQEDIEASWYVRLGRFLKEHILGVLCLVLVVLIGCLILIKKSMSKKRRRS